MPFSRSLTHYAILLLLIGVNVGCDQVSKMAVRKHMDNREVIALIGDNLTLTRVENTGAFLSLGDDLAPEVKTFWLNLFPAISLALMLYWLFSRPMPWQQAIPLCCIIGGGIGNIYDRILYGSVTDFLFLRVGVFRTGVFNFADLSITCGVIVLMVVLWMDQRSKKQSFQQEPSPEEP